MKGYRLNILTAIIGFLLVLSGILKYFNMLGNFEISIGNAYFVVYNSTSQVYIVIVNLIGGGSMLFHALSTINLRKSIQHQPEQDILDITPPPAPEPKTMSKLSLLTAIISIMIAFFNFLRTMVLLSAFEKFSLMVIPFIIIVIIVYGSMSFIPIWLASKNLSWHNRSGDVLQQRKNAEIRAKVQTGNRRRR